MVNRLNNTTALVTGINSYVGCEIGSELARNGVHVIGSFHPAHAEMGMGIRDVREKIGAVMRGGISR